MLLSRRFLPLLLGLVALAPAARAQVKVSLVAADDSIQAGRPIIVALHFVHDPNWHTYWVNPGTGLTTAVSWKLPPGWKAGPIQWPAPRILQDGSGNIIGNGYQGDLFLPVNLVPPADLRPGTEVKLKAKVDWLMCKDVCKPGSAMVSLTLPVSTGPLSPDARWSQKIHAVLTGLPRADPRWIVHASRSADTITLAVSPNLRLRSAAGPHPPSGLHFFSDDDLVAYDQPQIVREDGRGGFVLTLPVSPDGPPNAAKLVGVLTSETGWLPNGSLRGLRIDIPLTAAGPQPTLAPAPLPAPPTRPAETAPGLIATLLLAFAGGLILNLMPCVFPVLGIKILGFVNQAQRDRSKVVAHGLVFSAGVLISFWALAGLLAALRASGAELGWGFQLQSAGFVFGLAAVMLVFALNLSGVFEFGLSAAGIGGNLQNRSGLTGSFFTGMLATLVATPCSAPFLAPALGAALALSFLPSFAIFTAIAIGLSAPYLLLAIFPGAVKILPRPGVWMETFKQLMAFPLYATVGYLVWVLAGQATEEGLQDALFGLVLVAMAAWAYGRWNAPGANVGRAQLGRVLGAALLGLGLWIGWPHSPANDAIVWEPWSPESVAQLRAEDRIVYVDFTARWCATCQANKKIVFHSGEVLSAFRDKNIATLRGDWTNKDPQITAELAKYHRSAVPFNLIWFPDRPDPIILPPLLTPNIVLKALQE